MDWKNQNQVRARVYVLSPSSKYEIRHKTRGEYNNETALWSGILSEEFFFLFVGQFHLSRQRENDRMERFEEVIWEEGGEKTEKLPAKAFPNHIWFSLIGNALICHFPALFSYSKPPPTPSSFRKRNMKSETLQSKYCVCANGPVRKKWREIGFYHLFDCIWWPGDSDESRINHSIGFTVTARYPMNKIVSVSIIRYGAVVRYADVLSS